MGIKKLASVIAKRCSDAYSADRYRSWTAVAKALLERGYNEQDTEAIMRGVYTRWAADKYNGTGRAPASILTDYLDNTDQGFLKQWLIDYKRNTSKSNQN